MPVSDALTHEKLQTILDAARKNFAAHGYEGASMAAITVAAGVSKTTIYHHFASKAGLFGAVVGRECERLLVHFADSDVRTGRPEAVLRMLGRRMVDMLVSPVCLMIDRVVTAEAEAFPELAEAFWAAGPQRGIAQLSAWLRDRTASGELAVVDCEFAAEQFFTLVQARSVFRARLRLAAPTEAELERAVDAAVAMFLAVYGVRKEASG